MSAFAALEELDGDTNVEELQKKKKQAEKETREREAVAAKMRFEELRAKGASNWADSDDDDDEFFKSPPVRPRNCPPPVVRGSAGS